MEMLLRHVTIEDLRTLLIRHRDRSPLPELFNPRQIAQAVALAQKNGVWQDLDQHQDPRQPIEVVRRSEFRDFQRSGERGLGEKAMGRKRRALNRAALALWLNHPKADLDYLQDLIWAACEETTWVSPAHETRAIDLGAAQFAATLAEVVHLFSGRLESEVIERVHTEIRRRIYDRYADWTRPDFWNTARHNWNHVVNGEIVRTALYDLEDPAVLAHLIHPAISHMTYALDGFSDDGGCLEGPSYWDYGFGHYLKAAYALYRKTNGELNLMADAKILAICRFPLAADIAAPVRATFSDAQDGYLTPEHVLIINRFFSLPALFALAPTHPDRQLKLTSLHELAMSQEETAPTQLDSSDYWLPDLGLVKLRGDHGANQLTVTAMGGNNGVNHNHNDLGSFMVYARGTTFISDPGRPIYRRDTFSQNRYQSLYCNSWGHSVPIINGEGQQPGSAYYAQLQVEGLTGQALKTARLDLTHAYADGALKCFERIFTLAAAKNHLWLEDRFVFDVSPQTLEEAFITFQPATVIDAGHGVRIGSSTTLELTSDSPGIFSLEPRPDAAIDDPLGRTLTRILFTPSMISHELTLRFGFL